MAAKHAEHAKGKQPRRGDADNLGMRPEPPLWVDSLATDVIGAAIEVHRVLGCGFLESIYEAALAEELAARAIPFEQQVAIPILYRGKLIGEHRLDLLVSGALVLELKATLSHHDVHLAQTLSYLHAGSFPLGLILNFSMRTMKEGVRRVFPL